MKKPTPLYLLPREVDAVRAGTLSRVLRVRQVCVPGDWISVRRWTGAPYRSVYETISEVQCTEATPLIAMRSRANVGRRVVRDIDELDAIARSVGFDSRSALADHYYQCGALPWCGSAVGWRSPL